MGKLIMQDSEKKPDGSILHSDSTDLDQETSGVVFEVVEKEFHEGKRVRRRGVYLLPNLFTTGALFSAFYAIIYAMNGRFELAAIAIFVSMIFDGLDGRVARLTNTQSEFGAQYDSLADCISFGVAPALVSYAWALSSLGKIGWTIGFIYLACAALRLARFNVQLDTADKRYFTGLPSPSAAAVVAGMVWLGVDQGIAGADIAWVAALLTGFSAVMMVSNVKYNSFKQLDFKGRVPFVAIPVVVLATAIIAVYPSGFLLALFLLYAISGPVLHFWRKDALAP
ncbi:CDP-diacylglycerol-serine O-phosphatidyltransferase [gamma proteobacterium HdN1]|nr:CDP-diacylglycerol-serine O-phosphatidyltransferase [gamma proteobacterium HdN1]